MMKIIFYELWDDCSSFYYAGRSDLKFVGGAKEDVFFVRANSFFARRDGLDSDLEDEVKFGGYERP